MDLSTDEEQSINLTISSQDVDINDFSLLTSQPTVLTNSFGDSGVIENAQHHFFAGFDITTN